MTHAYLPERALIRIGGSDAEAFLHSLITTDVEGLPEGEARPGALLTPQGKILFDFLIWRDAGGFLLETDAAQRDGLLKRLAMYKLRAAVEISAEAEDGVTVFWDGEGGGIIDGRFARAGLPLTRQPGKHGDGGPEAYDALRIGAGIAHSGSDFALQDAFPHDALTPGRVKFETMRADMVRDLMAPGNRPVVPRSSAELDRGSASPAGGQ